MVARHSSGNRTAEAAAPAESDGGVEVEVWTMIAICGGAGGGRDGGAGGGFRGRRGGTSGGSAHAAVSGGEDQRRVALVVADAVDAHAKVDGFLDVLLVAFSCALEEQLAHPAAPQLLLLPGENPLHFPVSGGIGAGGLEIPPDSQYTTQTIHPTAEGCEANKRAGECAAAAAWWLASRSSLRMQSWRYVSR